MREILIFAFIALATASNVSFGQEQSAADFQNSNITGLWRGESGEIIQISKVGQDLIVKDCALAKNLPNVVVCITRDSNHFLNHLLFVGRDNSFLLTSTADTAVVSRNLLGIYYFVNERNNNELIRTRRLQKNVTFERSPSNSINIIDIDDQ